MAKYKYILLCAILLCTITTFAQPAQYTPMTAAGYQMKRLKVDSTLHLPSFCGAPTLRGSVAKEGALAIDTCGAILYMWTNQFGWDTVNTTGGGGGESTDTTSLSNRINLKLNIADTSSMLSTYLRSVDTTNKFVNRLTRTPGKDSIIFFVGGNRLAIKDSVGSGGGSSFAVDTIFRTLGKDSIFYKKNNITYAIKDSVGTNPPASGYYGAFQDTTTQTAASINTAYGVKLGVTDLSNGVTISNNTRIKIANAGIYNIQFSLQLEKTGGSGNMIADIWLRKNGVNLQGTTGKVVLTGSTNASPIVAAWNYVIAVSSNDSLELMWSTSNDNVVIKAAPATSPHPSIPSAILTVTQQSGIMAGTGISPLDTANMLLPYLRKTDTTALQRKQIPSYTFLANNTTATANAQALPFKDTSGTYTGSIAWNGTAPTSGNLSYRWTRIGKMVMINISLIYANAGSANTQVVVALPSDAPTPTKPAGLTAASNLLYPAISQINVGTQNTLTSNTMRGMLRSNSFNNGFEFFINSASNAAINCFITCTYFTD